MNALRNAIVSPGSDREIDEFLKECNSCQEKSLNALRNSNVFDGSDREVNEFFKEFDIFWESPQPIKRSKDNCFQWGR